MESFCTYTSAQSSRQQGHGCLKQCNLGRGRQWAMVVLSKRGYRSSHSFVITLKLLMPNSLCTKHCPAFTYSSKYEHHLSGTGKCSQRAWGWHWFTNSWNSNSYWFPLNMPRGGGGILLGFSLRKDLLHAMWAVRNSPLKPRTKNSCASKLFTSRFIAELFNLLYTGNCFKHYFFCTTFFRTLLKTH